MLSLLWCTHTLGNPNPFNSAPNTKVNIGYLDALQDSKKVLLFNMCPYPLYDFLDTTYIPLDYLEHMGAELQKKDDALFINATHKRASQALSKIVFNTHEVYFNPSSLYINHVKTYSIISNDHVLVPVTALALLWNMSEEDRFYFTSDKLYTLADYLSIDDTSITNESNHVVQLSVLDLLWDGEQCIEHKRQDIILEAHQQLPKYTALETMPPETCYLTTFVTEINSMPILTPSSTLKGQKNVSLFKAYTTALSKFNSLETVFKPTLIKGTLKYAAGALKKGDSVTILWAEKRNYYVAKDSHNREVLLPWNSVKLQESSSPPWSQVSKEQIEDYTNLKNISSTTDYLLWTDLFRQRTYVLKRVDDRKWELEKTFVCATGKINTPTPSGFFKIQYAIPYFGMDHGYRCKNAMVFFKEYMYHSIPFDRSGSYITKGQLGYKVSGGCVRLSESDSLWIYTHVPVDSTVWIQ